MDDPLEQEMAALLDEAGISYIRPDRVSSEPTNLDFYIPALSLYIEVKAAHTPRIADQLALVPADRSALVLVGREAVKAFVLLAGYVSLPTSSDP